MQKVPGYMVKNSAFSGVGHEKLLRVRPGDWIGMSPRLHGILGLASIIDYTY